jgi:hypothetical protein
MPKVPGKWKRVFVPDKELTPEELQQEREEHVHGLLSLGLIGGRMESRFAAVEQWRDYFPGENEVPEGGAWVLVKKSPQCEYTVPPLSLWFAEPWPMESSARVVPHRVKIVTPRGDLGLFPHEYSRVDDVSKYYEFFGRGMRVRFFGGQTAGIPEMALFYLRSRGIAKADAISMLIGNIKAPGVLWVETERKVARAFVRDKDWPHKSRLATVRVKEKVTT